MSEQYEVGERFIFIEKGSKWIRYFSKIDFEKGIMNLYTDERKEGVPKEILIKNCVFYDAVVSKNRPCTIKIQPTLKNDKENSKQMKKKKKKKIESFYVSSNIQQTIDELKVELEECEGTFEGLDIMMKAEGGGILGGIKRMFFGGSGTNSGSIIGRLGNIDVSEWSKKDVQEWLKLIKMEQSCLEVFAENDIDGSIIVELEKNNLQSIRIEEQDAERLMIEINLLKKNRRFSRAVLAVKSKLERFSEFRVELTEFQEFLDTCSDVTKMKHRYMSTADLRPGRRGRPKRNLLGEDKIKVKIVIVEKDRFDPRTKKLKDLASPIYSGHASKLHENDFGTFVTALIVGPWYLEWSETEIILPKRVVSGRDVILSGIEVQVRKEGLKWISHNLAEMIVRWNTCYKHSNNVRTTLDNNDNDKKKDNNENILLEGNCQHFIDEILRIIRVESNFKGALEEFLEKMRRDGQSSLEFSPCSQFREHFGIKESSWVFRSHQELDLFCVKIRENCIDVSSMYQPEWTLLRSFDRVFWLRYLKYPTDQNYTPLPPAVPTMKPYDTGCPFLDPRNFRTSI